MYFLVLFFNNIFSFLGMLYYSYTQTCSLSLLYCCYSSYCVSFCALLDGVCLSRNKKITYLLTYLLTYLCLTSSLEWTSRRSSPTCRWWVPVT